MFGGLLLLAGLASRLITIPMMVLLVTAYLTADNEAMRAIFSDPDEFLSAAEFNSSSCSCSSSSLALEFFRWMRSSADTCADEREKNKP